MNCEVCGSLNFKNVLDLGKHPMCDDLIQIGDTRECKEYPIKIKLCQSCNTALQEYSVPKIELFPNSYHYRSRHTQDVLDGMKELVENINIKLGSLDKKHVLDIGCNDGSLLNIFRDKGAITRGFEPTGAYLDARESGHEVYNNFFDIENANKYVSEFGEPDIITFTNVFAHIENLPSLIDSLKVIINESKTTLVIENHYLGKVLEKMQFDTFYHEHPRTYSLGSFVEIAKSLNLNICDASFPSRYGGNIRVILSNNSKLKLENGLDEHLNKTLQKENYFLAEFQKLNDFINKWKVDKSQELQILVSKYGPLTAKAFPGRSAIPIKLLNLDTHIIEKTHEKPLSAKLNHFIPSTRIPIRSDDEINYGEYNKPIVNFAWHIDKEITNYLRNKGFQGEIVNII